MGLNNLKNKRGAMALSQILLLVISIVALSYALGSEVKMVSAVSNMCSDKCKDYTSYSCTTGALCTYGMGTNNGATLDCTKKGENNICCCYSKKTTITNQETSKTNVPVEVDDVTSNIDDEKDKSEYDKWLTENDFEDSDENMEKFENFINEDRSAYDLWLEKNNLESSDENMEKFKSSLYTKEQVDIDSKDQTKNSTSKSKIAEWLGLKEGSTLSFALNAVMWAGIVYIGIKMIGPMLGLEDELVDAASMAAFWGVFAGKLSTDMLTKMGTANAQMWGGVIGAGVGVGLFILMYRKEKQEIITFTCYPWQASTGGQYCEECNKQGVLPCSEYQCRSLGQGCQIVNPGTDEQKCVWVNRNDVTYPTITPLEDALLEGYVYTPDNAVSPPDRGVRIELEKSTSGCVKAFTPLSFGVSLDEPAKCKIDGIRKASFADMDFFFSGGLSLYNHSYALSLPGSSALAAENITITTGGEYSLYVRCEDANGNSNTADFVFSFCVEDGPDVTAPTIITTTPLNGYPIAYNQSSASIIAYTNEPADCRWSHLDEDYENMEGNMTCSRSVTEMNAQNLYKCSTTLTGLKDRQENKFYFRCKDQPTGVAEEDRNTNAESYVYTLIGTQPLVIDWIKPENDTVIKDSTDYVKVTLEAKTSAGYKEGEAVCQYSETGTTGSYVDFLNTNSYQHSQDLWLPTGDYEYYIKCFDLGGNPDTEMIRFSVDSDSDSPIIVRAYHEETYLKLVTSESASCVYDIKYTDYPCDYSFDDGTKFTAINGTEHYTSWDAQNTFYVICKDEFGNQPLPNECSIIVRPSDFSG